MNDEVRCVICKGIIHLHHIGNIGFKKFNQAFSHVVRWRLGVQDRDMERWMSDFQCFHNPTTQETASSRHQYLFVAVYAHIHKITQ